MVNRIDGNYHDYTSAKTVNTVQDSGEKFSLNYNQENLQTEEQEKKEEKEKTLAAERSGVKLELSRSGQQADVKWRQEKTKAQEQSRTKEASFLDTLQKFITDFLQAVKMILNRIWNDPEPEDTVQSSDVTPEEAERYTEEYLALKGLAKPETAGEITEPENISTDKTKSPVDKDAEIQKYLHTGNLEQVISLLTDNGQKTIAKNSNLLTYYDRSGRLTQINASDRERILHGDRNTKKL
ncbi:MAG: hypothetical protein J6K48_09185 [Lachnospiraceae bacterium]|nr:hypothetical protein [Lachnospiraceae bacterium]